MLACRVAPAGIERGQLLLLADERSDLSAALAAATAAGLSISLRSVPSEELEKALERLHSDTLCSTAHSASNMVLREDAAPYHFSPRQHYVEMLVARALTLNASDIHIQPLFDALEIRMRVDGHLRGVEKMPSSSAASLVAQIKVLARLPLAEKRLPHDGRFSLTLEGRSVELRVSILPSIHGEAVVLRLGEDEAPLALDKLHMPGNVRRPVERLLLRKGGLFLVGGPTGSGKTTTLYALMRHLCEEGRKLISVEDPVERVIAGVNQVPVEQGGMGFGDAVRAMLRHSPDAILIGEIRDAPTAAAAAEAALTGHLVLASAHARDAVEVASRLMDLGVSAQVLSCVLEAALTQRLVRLLCPHCARPAVPPDSLRRALGLSIEEVQGCKDAVGCPHCAGSGYLGRRAIFGLVTASPAIRAAISSGAGAHALRSIAQKEAMPSLRANAAALVKAGLTSAVEALASACLSQDAA